MFAYLFIGKKKNAHSAVLQAKIPFKKQKNEFFIKNRMLKDRKQERPSSSLHLPHERCKSLHKESFVTQSSSLF